MDSGAAYEVCMETIEILLCWNSYMTYMYYDVALYWIVGIYIDVNVFVWNYDDGINIVSKFRLCQHYLQLVKLTMPVCYIVERHLTNL